MFIYFCPSYLRFLYFVLSFVLLLNGNPLFLWLIFFVFFSCVVGSVVNYILCLSWPVLHCKIGF